MMISPLDPGEFLTLAVVLASMGTEVSLRTAVGRAYYSVFLLARDRLGLSGSADMHRRVIAALGQRKGHRKTATRLGELRRLRAVADYQMLPVDPAERDWGRNWRRAYALATRVQKQLERI